MLSAAAASCADVVCRCVMYSGNFLTAAMALPCLQAQPVSNGTVLFDNVADYNIYRYSFCLVCLLG